MTKLGRKPKSDIRTNLVELLFFIKEDYGYDLYKKYISVFDKKVSIRSIYYNLTKGVEIGIFRIKNIEQAHGDYSWGNNVQRVIFSLGKEANPRGLQEIYEKICALDREKKINSSKRV